MREYASCTKLEKHKESETPDGLTGKERSNFMKRQRRQRPLIIFKQLKQILFPNTVSKKSKIDILEKCLETISFYQQNFTPIQNPVFSSIPHKCQPPRRRKKPDQSLPLNKTGNQKRNNSTMTGESDGVTAQHHQKTQYRAVAIDQQSANTPAQRKSCHKSGRRSIYRKSSTLAPGSPGHSAPQTSSDSIQVLYQNKMTKKVADNNGVVIHTDDSPTSLTRTFLPVEEDQTTTCTRVMQDTDLTEPLCQQLLNSPQLEEILTFALQNLEGDKCPVEIEAPKNESESTDIYPLPMPDSFLWNTDLNLPTSSNLAVNPEKNWNDKAQKRPMSTLIEMLEIPEGPDQEKEVLEQCINRFAEHQAERKRLMDKLDKLESDRHRDLTRNQPPTARKAKKMATRLQAAKQSKEKQRMLIDQVQSQACILKSSINTLKTKLNYAAHFPFEESHILSSLQSVSGTVKELSGKITSLQEELEANLPNQVICNRQTNETFNGKPNREPVPGPMDTMLTSETSDSSC